MYWIMLLVFSTWYSVVLAKHFGPQGFGISMLYDGNKYVLWLLFNILMSFSFMIYEILLLECMCVCVCVCMCVCAYMCVTL